MPNGVPLHAPPAALPAHHACACALSTTSSAPHVLKLACKAPAGSWLMCVPSTWARLPQRGSRSTGTNRMQEQDSEQNLLGTTRRPLQTPGMHTQSQGFCAGWQLAGAPAFVQPAEAVHLAAARGASVRAGPSSAGPRHGISKHARSKLARSKAPAGSWLDAPANMEFRCARHAAAAMAPAT